MRPPRSTSTRAYRGALRAAVRRQWRAEERLRRLADPAPIPVRWRLAPAALAVRDHDVNVFGGQGSVTATGTLEELAGFLRGLPSARLVILGDPGAGKTTAAIRLVLDLTADRPGAPDDRPVPVLLSVGSWRPDRQDLRAWLRDVIRTDYPALAAAGPDGSSVAETLVEEGGILPVLDGLDELPPAGRAEAVAAVNAALNRGEPLVVTCRTAEYQAAVSTSDTVTGAAVVQLRPLTPAVLSSYLPRTAPPRADATTTWDRLLAEVGRRPRAAPAERVLAVLRTPFMASLAREAYSETGADPAELLDRRRFPHAADIEAHLLDQAVPAAYRGCRPSAPVGRWLAALARRMDRDGTYDLAWWRLFRQGAARLDVAAGAAVGGAAVGILSTVVRDPRLSAVAVLLGAAIGALVGHRQPPVPSTAQWSIRGGLRRAWRAAVAAGRPVRAGAVGWLVALLALGSIVGLRSGWPAAVIGAAAVGVTRALDAWLDVPLDMTAASAPTTLLRSDRAAGLSRATLRAVLLGTTSWLLAGSLAGAAVGAAAFVASVGFTAWFRFTLARLSQALIGRLPWRLPAFLADAARRGVLRQAGGVYQFRHARLQDRLAGRPPPPGELAVLPEEQDEPAPETVVAPAPRPVAVILTALDVEYDAVRAHLNDVTPVVHPTGTLFEVGRLRGGHRSVALTVLGEGNQTAAVIAERAATLFQPDLMLFSGVAGALHGDLALGDVVVGTRVYAYHSGREAPNGFLARPRAWDAPHRLEQRARHLSRSGRWRALLPDPTTAPTVHFRPIAAGEVVMTAPTSRQASILRRHYDDAAAIEMEGAGLARAAHLHDALPALVVRGISDRADERKEALDRAAWKRVAAANAAAFALGLVTDLPVGWPAEDR